MSENTTVDLLKVIEVDEEIGLVIGYAIVSTDEMIEGADKRYFDQHGDHIPNNAIGKALVDFALSGAAGKVMHKGDVVADVIGKFWVTHDIAKALGWTIEREGLVIQWRPRDMSKLNDFKPGGAFGGFSIGGTYGETEHLPDA